MESEYYACPYRLDGSVSHLIWHTNDRDGVVLDDGGHLLTAGTLQSLTGLAAAKGIVLDPTISETHDLDPVDDWLKDLGSGDVDCDTFLTAWNLFDDVQSSAGTREKSAASEYWPVYEKLFWGTNPPSLTPEGERYVPHWSADEIAALRLALSEGLAAFRSKLSDADAA